MFCRCWKGINNVFVVVYHELTTLRQGKPILALLIHDIPLRNIVEPLNNSLKFKVLQDAVRICGGFYNHINKIGNTDSQPMLYHSTKWVAVSIHCPYSVHAMHNWILPWNQTCYKHAWGLNGIWLSHSQEIVLSEGNICNFKDKFNI